VKSLLVAIALVALTACTADTPISVSGAWIRLPPSDGAPAAAYMTINNHGAADLVLTDVQSPKFARIEIHETRMQDGVMQMRPIERITLAPGSSLELKPGGVHLMLLRPTTPLVEGEKIALTLQTENAPVLELLLTVQRTAPK
jgi:copper(I)-binding protein